MILNEVNDLAGQHEVIAENLQSEVVREINLIIKDFKDERKKLLTEGARMTSLLHQQIACLERARKNYEKAFKEAEKALENYQRADLDLNLSRAELDRQKTNMQTKSQQCEDAKNEYANQLQRTNEQQRQHYQHLMPEIYRQLQDLDEKRIRNIRNFMIQSAQVEMNVSPIISKCLDGVINAANQINEKEDTLLVIDRYKSGFLPPTDIPFEDLSKLDGAPHTPKAANHHPGFLKPEALTYKGTVSGGKQKSRTRIFNIFSSNKNNISGSADNKDEFSDLPPNQRKKKLQMKIEDLQNKIHQETAARDGLMKMKGVYEQNSQLGDPIPIESQLIDCGNRLDKLRMELAKYTAYLEENQNPTTNLTPIHNNLNGVKREHRNSGGSGCDDNSLSRSASYSSVSANHNHKQSAPGTPLPSHGNSDSPESGISHTSLPESDDAPLPYYDTELLPPLGTCRALYPFEATSEGSIPMANGEELYVIEVDQGDGWTRVRRPADSMEGFVPTTYIECTLDNC